MEYNETQVQWTEEQWNLVQQTVRDEARKVRVAASFLAVHGPLPPDTESVPIQTFYDEDTSDPGVYGKRTSEAEKRLLVDDTKTRPLTTISVNVYLRRSQV